MESELLLCGAPPLLQTVDRLAEKVVDSGALQFHVEPDPGPIVAEFEEGSGDPVRADKLVVPGVEDDQVRLIPDDFGREVQQTEGIDGGHTAVNDFEVSVRIDIDQHFFEKMRKSRIGRVGKTEQSRGPYDKNAHRIRWFFLWETRIVRYGTLVLLLKETVADVRIDLVYDLSILVERQKKPTGRTCIH